MVKPKVELDSAGIAEILNSPEVRAAVHGLAEQVAANVRAVVDAKDGVVVDDYTTDRAASSVTIRDASGKLWEVRDGVLTRAASSVGLELGRRRV